MYITYPFNEIYSLKINSFTLRSVGLYPCVTVS